MKVKVSQTSMLKALPCLLCLIYYCTYMFWDSKTRTFKYLILLLLVTGVMLEVLKSIKRRPTIHERGIVLLFIFLESIYLIYSLAASDILQRNTALYQYCFYTLLLCGAIYFTRCIDLYKCLSFLRYLGCILAILSVYEFTSGTYIIPTDEWYGKISFGGTWLLRARVFSDSPMVFGLIMALMTLISFDYYKNNKNLLNIMIVVLNFIGLLLSSSRGPYVCFVLGVFVYFYFDEKINQKRLIKLIFGISMFILLVWISISLLANSNETIAYIYARFQSIFQWSGKSTQNWTANTTRMALWKNAINILFTGTNWIHGIGAAATGGRAVATGGFVTESGVLRRLVEFGIFIGVLYYIFLFRLIRYGITQCRKSGEHHIGLAMGLITCIMVEDVILQITEEISVTFFLWIFIAFMINSKDLSNNRTAKFMNRID